MSFLCIKCEKNALPDPHVAAGILPVVDESKKVPEAVKEEFSSLKEQLVEQLKDFCPELAKYDPKVHIICEQCLETILFPVEKEVLFEEANNEEIKKEVSDLKESIVKLERRLKQPDDVEAKEAILLRKLVDIEELEEDMESNLKNLAMFQHNYEKLEDGYWEELLTFENELFAGDQQRNSVNRQLKSVQNLLDKIDRINVLNDIIHISSDNDVATVNGLAVGKKATSSQIDWIETNGAIGQLILLFGILEVKCAGMKLDGIKMRPQGSYSEVVRITYETEEVYEMFGPPKDERQFNAGLTVLVEAMTQMHTYLSAKILKLIGGGTYDLPHKITNEDLKFHLFKVDKWTEAMRYFCFNCKHLIYLYGLLNKNNQIALKANKQL